MKLEEEMQIWETRSNDEFGKILKSIRDYASEIVMDIKESLDECMACYALDGNRKSILKRVENLLEAYDITTDNEYTKVMLDLIKLKELAN